MTSPKVELVFCGVPEGVAEMERLFADSCRLLNCLKLTEAKACISPETAVIVCGTQFDDGAMFDLLRHVKADPHLGRIPFLCVRIAGGSLEEALFKSVEMSAAALGAAGFIDLFRWRREFGADQTDRKYKETVAAIVAASRDGLSVGDGRGILHYEG